MLYTGSVSLTLHWWDHISILFSVPLFVIYVPLCSHLAVVQLSLILGKFSPQKCHVYSFKTRIILLGTIIYIIIYTQGCINLEQQFTSIVQ